MLRGRDLVVVVLACAVLACGNDGGDERPVPTGTPTLPTPTPVATVLPAGALDPSFGAGGLVTTSVDGTFESLATAIAVQTDGKIVVGGGASPLDAPGSTGLLLRLEPDGSPDPSFGRGGAVTLTVGGSTVVEAIAIARDGKILAAGGSDGVGAVIARFDADGTLDPSFGRGGIVTRRVGELSHALDVVVQADDRIVAVGSTAGAVTRSRFAVARWHSDGSPDEGFGRDGLVTTNVGGSAEAQAVVIQADGRLVVGGTVTDADGAGTFAVVRYASDGTLERSFGERGVAAVTPARGFGSLLAALVVQADGSIVALGSANPFGFVDQPPWLALVRFDRDGRLDPSFGSDGLVRQGLGGNTFPTDLVQQPDGRLVVAAHVNVDERLRFAVARFEPDGVLDRGFGDGGVVTTPVRAATFTSGAALQPDGKILVAGFAEDISPFEIVIARYLGTAATPAP